MGVLGTLLHLMACKPLLCASAKPTWVPETLCHPGKTLPHPQGLQFPSLIIQAAPGGRKGHGMVAGTGSGAHLDRVSLPHLPEVIEPGFLWYAGRGETERC